MELYVGSARAQVVVNVINVDEAAPEFDGPCDANFLETDSLMQVVTTCSATDSDTGRTTKSFTDLHHPSW